METQNQPAFSLELFRVRLTGGGWDYYHFFTSRRAGSQRRFSAAEVRMRKWEYRILKTTSVDDETQKKMNAFGEEGWELVDFKIKEGLPPLIYYIVFRREKTD